MARASTRTILSLERFAQVLGISPLEINQITGTGCGQTMYQYAWQHPGRIGREDLAYAIQHAEDLVFDFLGFYPGVIWSEEVFPVGPRARNAITATGLGMFIEGGKQAKTLIEADAGVTYDDLDEDGFSETATIEIMTSLTDPEEIAVFYPGHDGDDAWEIRPLRVVIADGLATITGKRWQFTTETAQEIIEPSELDRDDDAVFVEEVDVYRRFNDPSVQAQFEGYKYPCYACSGDGCLACESELQSACIRAIAPSQGVLTFIPSTWNADAEQFNRAEWACAMDRPQRIRAWIRSGWRDPRRTALRNTILDPRVERAIALLTMAEIGPEGLCVCLSHIHERWAVDRAFSESTDDGTSRAYRLSTDDLHNVFGTTLGGYEAWRLLREVRNGRAAY